jgi:hypothetical protein
MHIVIQVIDDPDREKDDNKNDGNGGKENN